MREQIKLIPILQEKLIFSSNKVDELNSLIRIHEGQITSKNSNIVKLSSELGTLKLKNEELSNVILKHKEITEDKCIILIYLFKFQRNFYIIMLICDI